MLKFDYDKLYSNLMKACRMSFLDLQERYHQESFYAFGLFTTLDYDQIHITANTEAGLIRRAEYYLEQNKLNQNSLYVGYDLNEIKIMLRDIPTDWAYHNPEDYASLFQPIHEACQARRQQIKQIQQVYYQKLDNPSQLSQIIKPLNDQFLSMCLNVLHDLDIEGIFNAHQSRESIRINLLLGNQSENERKEFCYELNPLSVFQLYEEELDIRDQLYTEMGSRREQAIKRSVAEALQKQREDLANWEKRYGQRKN